MDRREELTRAGGVRLDSDFEFASCFAKIRDLLRGWRVVPGLRGWNIPPNHLAVHDSPNPRLARAIEQLRPREREHILLWMFGVPIAHIASNFGMSEGSERKTRQRILDKLKELLQTDPRE